MLSVLLAKIFGSRFIKAERIGDSSTVVTSYRFRNCLYVTKVEKLIR
jgi:hypothetical protein